MLGKFALFGLLALLVACSGDDPEASGPSAVDAGVDVAAHVCEPGRQVECACPGGQQGAQRCRDDGTGWETCACPDASVEADATDDVVVEDAQADSADAPTDVVGEADAEPDYCSTTYASFITCSHTCAKCVESQCDSECAVMWQGGSSAFGCYCTCIDHFQDDERQECYALCDQKYAYGGTILDSFPDFTSCVRTNCPEECEPRPD